MARMSASHLARIATDAVTAGRLADAFAEWLGAPVATFVRDDGGWSVEIHFDAAPEQGTIRNLVRAVAGDGASDTLIFETVSARDWVAASLAQLKPVAAGRFVVHGAHDRAAIAPPRLGIEIEAALAFGTGHHGTTHGCLLAFDRMLKVVPRARLAPAATGGSDSGPVRPSEQRSERKKYRVLDVGTGTGVLAIAAARALRQPVLASDIDGRAVRVARDNARINHVASQIEFLCAPGLSLRRMRERAPYDLVFANILLSPLRLIAAPMRRLLAPHARVILSGLLPAQANAALAAYRTHGLALERRIVLDGWATLVLRFRSSSHWRHPRYELRNRKSTSKPMIPVRF
jgi:ribosomal protein L11 methyltransferase